MFEIMYAHLEGVKKAKSLSVQGFLHPAAFIDALITGWNAAHIIPSVATLFEIVISANGHNPLYPSLDPNLDPKLG